LDNDPQSQAPHRLKNLRSHLFLLQQAINLRFTVGKEIVFTWVGEDAISLWLNYEGDRFFCRSGDHINGARVKNVIAEKVLSQAFISGLLIKNAIALSDGFGVLVLKQHGSRRWKRSP
jgi:hypothetical protein